MADNGNQQETIRCSRCKKQFFEDGFKVNRLGRRLKTCLECNARKHAEHERDKCPHRRRKSTCKDCGGSEICPHGRQRSKCCECGGASICEHNRQRSSCRECGGASICEHNRHRQTCRACGGSAYCEHHRLRKQCWLCAPVSALWARASVRINGAIGTKARAGRSTAELLGCDKATFFHHIEAQFKDGMSWARISEIEIDHRVPIEYKGVAGGPPTLEEKVARLNYLNCQPMWTADNLCKGNRWADPQPEVPQPQLPAEPEKCLTLTDDEVTEALAGFGFF